MRTAVAAGIAIAMAAAGIAGASDTSPIADALLDGNPAGARAMAMGGAYTAIGQGLETPLYNPGALGQFQDQYAEVGMHIAANRFSNAADSDLNNADPMMGQRITYAGWVGWPMSVFWHARTKQDTRTTTATTQEDIHCSLNRFAVGYGFTKNKKIFYGLTISYLNGRLSRTLVPLSGNTPAAIANIAHANGIQTDWGLLWAPFDKFSLGFALLNAPALLWWDDYSMQQPGLQTRIGVAGMISHHLRMAMDYEHRFRPGDLKNQYHFGLEQRFGAYLRIREGFAMSRFKNFTLDSKQSLGLSIYLRQATETKNPGKVRGPEFDLALERSRLAIAGRPAVITFLATIHMSVWPQ